MKKKLTPVKTVCWVKLKNVLLLHQEMDEISLEDFYTSTAIFA